MDKKTAVLLINLGTPDAPDKGAVGRYLKEFLNDKRVIDIPTIPRTILVNGIIVPRRKGNSSKEYQKVWNENGSPLLYHTENLTNKVQAALGVQYDVYFAMRYQSPSLERVLEKIKKTNPDKIIVIPLYPQYASATTGSTLEKVMEIVKDWYVIPELSLISQFYDREDFINALAEIARPVMSTPHDHIIFSYHGLPERQLDKVYEGGLCSDRSCEHEVTEENKFCYKATCYHTTRLIAAKLGIEKGKYTVCFQSRLDDNWVRPYADDVIVQRAEKGDKNLVVFSPAFTADCLETLVEIGEGYDQLFRENGGEKVTLVPSLNDHPLWVQSLVNMVKERS